MSELSVYNKHLGYVLRSMSVHFLHGVANYSLRDIRSGIARTFVDEITKLPMDKFLQGSHFQLNCADMNFMCTFSTSAFYPSP